MNIVAVLATFLAASVEWVEALTIILAVGLSRGWRSALTGTAGALLTLAALVVVFVALGSSVGRYVPLGLARTLVGVFLLLFGIRWLHKAILRSGGLKALHDEDEAFKETREHLGGGVAAGALDWVGTVTAFNGTFLEGLEVVFIVIALAGLNGLPAATAGALGGLVVVAGAGVVIRHPLSRVPENTMKYVVGLMLTAFGTFFAGEGLGVQWWNTDLSLLPLIAGYGICSVVIVLLLRRPPALGGGRALRTLQGAAAEVWGLFVGEGPLAIAAVAVLLAIGLFVARAGHAELAGLLLAAGVVIALLIGLSDGFQQARRRSAAKAAEPAESQPEPDGEPADGRATLAGTRR